MRPSGLPRHQPHRHAVLRALPGVRPPRWQRRAVHASVLALVLTGVAWLIAHFLLRNGGEVDSGLPHPAEGWALRLHGIAAYGFLLVLGSMGAVHIVTAWRLGRNRWSGSVLLATAVLLVATALQLYYGPETAHVPTSAIHWAIGLLMLPLLWAHVLIARRRG
jgi:hypothetical protein